MNKPSPTNYLDRLRAKAEERFRAHAEGLKQLGPIARTVSQVENENANERSELKTNLLVLSDLLSAVCLHIEKVTAKL